MRLLGPLLASVVAWAAISPANLEKKVDQATDVFQTFVGNPDDAIPEALFRRAKCIVVIPNLIKGGLIVGARTGWGVGSCRTATGWSGAALFNLTGVSVGLQAGAQRTDLVLIFTRENAPERLGKPGLTLGAGISLAVGPIGRELEADTDPRFKSAVYAYSRTEGLYAGLNLEGARLRPRDNFNALAAPNLSAEQILTSDFDRTTAIPALARFVETLEERAP